MAMMTDPAFPAPAIGTVHLENSITAHRPIAIGESLAVSRARRRRRAAPQGHDLRVRHRGTRPATTWSGRARPPTSAAARATTSASSGHDVPRRAAQRRRCGSCPADLGRRYAAVSGDHNPIHLYPLTAKALGFPRQIAHGMWSKARCIAALENRLPDAVRVEVAFKKPIILPGTVAFGSTPTNDGYAFSLSNPKSGAPHLAGATTCAGSTTSAPVSLEPGRPRDRALADQALLRDRGHQRAVAGEHPAERRARGRRSPTATTGRRATTRRRGTAGGTRSCGRARPSGCSRGRRRARPAPRPAG